MEIKLDIQDLKDEALTANEYIHMYLVSQGRYSDAWVCAPLQTCDLKGLASTGYIQLNPFDTIDGWDSLPSEPKIQLQDRALALFREPVSTYRWDQFREAYPIKSGERRLHDSLDKCKLKFMYYAGISGVFDEMMKGLKNEKLARSNAQKKGTFMPDWKAMSVWLNQKHWLTYLDYESGDKAEVKEGRL